MSLQALYGRRIRWESPKIFSKWPIFFWLLASEWWCLSMDQNTKPRKWPQDIWWNLYVPGSGKIIYFRRFCMMSKKTTKRRWFVVELFLWLYSQSILSPSQLGNCWFPNWIWFFFTLMLSNSWKIDPILWV